MICPKCGPTGVPREPRTCARHGYIPHLTPRDAPHQPVPKGDPVILRYIPREALTDPEAPKPSKASTALRCVEFPPQGEISVTKRNSKVTGTPHTSPTLSHRTVRMPGLLQPERELTWSPDDRLIRARVKSFFTQKWNEMECDPTHPLAVTREQYDAWQAGQHIQTAMPQLNAEEREFLLTGATPEEWETEFGGEDE